MRVNDLPLSCKFDSIVSVFKQKQKQFGNNSSLAFQSEDAIKDLSWNGKPFVILQKTLGTGPGDIQK